MIGRFRMGESKRVVPYHASRAAQSPPACYWPEHLGKLDVSRLWRTHSREPDPRALPLRSTPGNSTVLNAGAALCVQQIKGDALILGGFVELNANRYQPEGE
jgi:hypothetical protein